MNTCKSVQAECLTILLVDELRRVGRGGFQPLQREKDYFIDSLLDNQYNTWELKPQIWTKFGLIQMSHQQEGYFWQRRTPSHHGAAGSLMQPEGAGAPFRGSGPPAEPLTDNSRSLTSAPCTSPPSLFFGLLPRSEFLSPSASSLSMSSALSTMSLSCSMKTSFSRGRMKSFSTWRARRRKQAVTFDYPNPYSLLHCRRH